MSTDTLRPHGPKKNHKKGYLAADRERKRREAEERNAAYAKKPLVEKLKTAGAKEKRKLLAKVEKQVVDGANIATLKV